MGYFKNSRFVAADGRSYPAADIGKTRPVTFVTSFEDGWIWHIAMRDTASVGLVINTNRARTMDKTERERFFLDTLRQAPYLDRLLEDAVYEEVLSAKDRIIPITQQRFAAIIFIVSAMRLLLSILFIPMGC